MTKINIGTTKKNIVGVEIDKPFNKIEFSDIEKIVMEKYKTLKGISIIGWCPSDEK